MVTEIGEEIFDFLYLLLSFAVGFFEFFDSATDFFFVESADFKSLFEDLYFFLSFFNSGLDHFDSVDHSSAAIFLFNRGGFFYWGVFFRDDDNFVRYDDNILSNDDFSIGDNGFDFFDIDLNLFFEFFDFLLDFNWIDLGVFLDEFLEFGDTFLDSSDFDDLLFDDDFGVFFNNFLFFFDDDLLFFDDFLFKLFDLFDHLRVDLLIYLPVFLDESLEDSDTFLLLNDLLFFGFDLLFNHDSIDFHFIDGFL